MMNIPGAGGGNGVSSGIESPGRSAKRGAHAVVDTRALDPGRPITLEAPGGVFASGDEDRLLQVLRNLLSNALRHTPAGTPVSVAGRSLPDDQVELTVTDHGPGMDPDTASRIFERFVKSIAEAHGGTVRVRTAAGEGSGFTVTLPAAH
jgi:two-component system OmpR family sensor kinase